MATVTISNKQRPLASLIKAKYCDSFICRLRGLMFRSHLGGDEGLLLVQSRENRVDASIHMLFVFTDLAVIWINSEKIVVDKVLARAWRPFYAPSGPAKYILEITPGRLSEFETGDQIEFIDA